MKFKSCLLLALLFAIMMPSCKPAPKAEIPILAWYSIPDEYATLERYQELKEAGFTVSFTHSRSFDAAVKALDLCAAVGIKSVFTCPELFTDPEETVKKVMNHPGLGYYFLRDEPDDDQMEELGKWARRIESVDSKHPCYLNLLPYYHPHFPTAEDYEKHIRLFSEKIALPQISYDLYPIIVYDGEVVVTPLYYNMFEIALAESRRTEKPFWAFTLATAHMKYPVPTISHLRLQLYSDLAYGAQCLQYFTYSHPAGTRWDFHESPIDSLLQRSPVYEIAREVNAEIQNRAFVFSGCTVKNVSHIGDSIPEGTHPLEALPSGIKKIDSFGKGALVSEISNNGKEYVVILNTSPVKPIELSLEFEDSTQMIRRDGSKVKAAEYGPLFVLTAGDVLIFETL